MKKLLLIINPVAGKGRGKSKLFEATDIFTKNGYRVTVMPTEYGKTEAMVAEEAVNYDRIVAIGGDGTLNSVASGIIKSGSEAPLGYIPMGSTNDVGYSLGLTKSIPEACKKIITTEPKYIDIGRIDEDYFVYIACAGMLTDVSYATSQQLKNALGHGAYVIKGLLELTDLQKSIYKIVLDDETIEGDFLYAGISNTLRAGGFFTLSKDSVSFDDGFFELTLIKNPDRLSDRVVLANDILNSNVKGKHFIHKKVSKATVYCEEPKVWSFDGENGGERSKFEFEVLKKRLKLIY